MGILKKYNQSIKKIERKRIDDFLLEINEISKKHKLMLIPIIGKYKAQFEVQNYIEEPNKEK